MSRLTGVCVSWVGADKSRGYGRQKAGRTDHHAPADMASWLSLGLRFLSSRLELAFNCGRLKQHDVEKKDSEKKEETAGDETFLNVRYNGTTPNAPLQVRLFGSRISHLRW